MPFRIYWGNPQVISNPEAAGTATLPKLQATGDATAEPFATGSPSLSQLIAAAIGNVPMAAVGQATLPSLTALASGSQGHEATGSPLLKQLTALGQALKVDMVATGTISLQQLMAAATALHYQFGGPAAVTLKSLTASGNAVVANVATGAILLQQLTAYAVGSPYTAVRRRIGIIFVAPSPFGVFIHNPWGPGQRIADITHRAIDVRRSYERMSVGHATLSIPKLDPDDHSIHQGNILVIVAHDQPTWVGPIYILEDDLASGVTNLQAADMGSVLAKRVASQNQHYTAAFGSHYIFRSLISNVNSRGHSQVYLPSIVENGPSIDDLFVGGQTILQALEELHNRTNWEWWIDNEVAPGYLRSTVEWGYRQGKDLSSTVHLWEGVHFNAATFRHDLSEGKQTSTVIGGFGKPLWERTAVTQAAALGPQRIDIGSIQQLAPELIVRTVQELPAGLRDERVRIVVTSESAAELAREAQREELRRLAAETSIRFIANDLVDRSALQVGNYITLHASLGHHNELNAPVRITAVQPDEELGITECLAELRI